MQQRSFAFSAQRGERLREAAIRSVASNAPSDWMERALAAVRYAAERTKELTTDAVWRVLAEWGVPPPPEPRAMGAIMRRAVDARIVDGTDRTIRSARAACHRRPCALYTSLVYVDAEDRLQAAKRELAQAEAELTERERREARRSKGIRR